MKNKHIVKNCFLYLLLILVVLIMLFPLLWGASASLRSDQELFQYALPFTRNTLFPVEITLSSYVEVFETYQFLRPIFNTLFVSICTVVLGCTIDSMAAFAFATFDFRYKKIIFGIILVSFMIPFESIALPLYTVVNKLGIINTYASLIVPCMADGLVLFLFTQFFKDLPDGLLEAARVDGASWITIFVKIMAPLSKPVFITAGLMIFISQWNAYLWPLVAARSENVMQIQTAMGVFQQQHSTKWSALYAASMITAVIPLTLFLPFQKYYIQGIASSGIKG